MSNINDAALARLRAADPAAAAPDAQGSAALAMLDRVLAEPVAPPPARSRPVGRRFALGAAGAAAVVAASALAVTTPWSSGQPASAYTVDKHADGTIRVTIFPAQLKHPAKLNAELRGTHTVALGMVPADQCPTPPAIDKAFEIPAAPSAEQVAALKAKMPVSYELRGDDGVLIIIQPKKIPAGDTLVLGYAFFKGPDGPISLVRPVVVTAVPSCLGGPTARTLPTPNE